MASNKAGMASGVEVARISVKVSPDSRQFRRELKRDLDAIEKELEADVPVEPDMDNFREEVKAKTKGMRAKVKVEPDVDKGFMNRLGDSFSKIKGPDFGSGINPAGMAVILGGITLLAAPLLGLITTALLAIPGLIAAVAVPIGALTLGLDGLKKAAEVLKAPFDNLKATMSSKVQEQFTPVLEKMRAVFPVLQASLPNVTAGLASMADSVVTAVTSADGLAMIQNTINNIANALKIAAPGLGDFVTGLLKLAESFTGGPLAGIAQWFTDTGKAFKNWVTDLTATQGAIGSSLGEGTGTSKMETAFKGLGDTIKIVLDLLGQLGEAGLKWIEDPSKVNDFKDGLKDIGDALRDIADLSSKINGAFKNLFPSLNFDGIKKDLTDPFTSPDAPWRHWDEEPRVDKPGLARFGMDAGVTDGKKYAEGVQQGAEQQLGNAAAGPTIKADPVIAGLVGDGTDAKNLQDLQDKLNTIKENASTIGPQIQAAVAPMLTIPAQIQTAFNGVGAAIQSSMALVVSAVVGAGSQIQAAFSAALAQLPATALQSLSGLPGVAVGIMAQFSAGIASGGQAAVASAQSVGAQITAALQAAAAGAVGAGAAVGQGMASGIESTTGLAVAAAQRMAAAVTAASKAELDSHSPSKVFIGIGESVGQGFEQGLENGVQPVLDKAKDIASQIADAFASGGDPTQFLEGMSKGDIKKLDKSLQFQLRSMEHQAKALDFQAFQSGKGDLADRLKAQAKDIRNQEEGIKLQKDMLDLTKEFNDESDTGGEDPFAKAVAGLAAAPVDFAKATGKQFLSDIGIGGNGLISKAITEGISYVFNIGSVDEALSIKDRTDRTQALTVTGRQ